jgi:hypothetical protein
MARNVLPDQYYTFSPSTNTITLKRAVKRETLLLITNVTTNTVIYNFSDPNLKATSYTHTSGGVAAGNPSDAITTIVLQYNTTSMSSTDKLQIIVDEYESKIVPGDVMTDPVGKMRVSEPQAMIDTDFEYGLQPTKWEQLSLINNRPSAFINIDRPNFGRSQASATTITSLIVSNGSRLVTVNVGSSTGFAVGQAVFIQDSAWAPANGLFLIETVPGGTSFTYKAKEAWVTGATPSTDINDANIPTAIFDAQFFTGAGLGGTLTYAAPVGQLQQVTTSLPHGLSVGNEIMLVNSKTGGTNDSQYGSHFVASVLSPTSFQYFCDTTANAGAPTASANTIYARPPGTSLHRAFDGGVQFSTNSPSHNHQMIRQTRRYFRYQSGKGIQVSTGTSLNVQLYVDALTSSGTTVTVNSKYQHNVQPGVYITIGGANETAYNGTFLVTAVLDAYRFQYLAGSTPSATTASGNFYGTITSWYGAGTRVGMFDSQNGMFFEFDGQTLYTVKRNSTYQVGGFISVNANDNTVNGLTINGVTTQFSKQVQPNDFVVIRGSSYRVLNVLSDTQLTIYPAYRGQSNLTKGVMSKTQDFKTPQSAWNIDRCDGTGPSGFVLNLAKMQMFYMDYSWYGAGSNRWGFRSADGNITYVHKVVNNNQNTEAWMRSGNLPARYETNTFSKYTTLAATLNSGDASMTVASTAGFPSSGTLMVRNGTQTEYVNYTGLSSTTFTGLTRGQAGSTGITATLTTGSNTITLASTTGVQVGQYVYTSTPGQIPQGTYVVSFVTNTSVTLSRAVQATGSIAVAFAPLGQTAQTFSYSATAPTAVELHAPLCAATVQHWGTSVIMDGKFDDDKSYVFTRGVTTPISIAAGANNAIMQIRIAPTVSNGSPSSLIGSRDLINRMQLVMRQLDVYANGSFLITIVLNGVVSSNVNWLNQNAAGGVSLAQYYLHSAGVTISGGEVIGGFYTNPGSGTGYTATSLDLSAVRDLGNSILGGGVTSTQSVYPDAPDVITIMAQNVGASAANIASRLSWTEAQA